MDNKAKEFGRMLKSIRESKKMTQFEVENSSFISEKTISRLERGIISDASIYSLIELSKVYSVDLVPIYISKVYGGYYLLKDIENKLDMNSMLLNDFQVDSYYSQLETLKSYYEMKNNYYDIDLLMIFLSYLKNNRNQKLKEEFDFLSSKFINKKNILIRSHSPMELRILINICSNFHEYKGISSRKIIDNCIDQLNGKYLNIMALNSRANIEYIDNNYKEALKYTNIAITNARSLKSIEGLSYLYYTKFICEYKLSNESYKKSLLTSEIFAENTNNAILIELIKNKSKIILS